MRQFFTTKIIIILACMAATAMKAQSSFDDIRTALEDAPVQEKVYLHIDNNCYFKGDTIWYKAYVVGADNLTWTEQSRIVYVELLSPDGLLVERQTLVVDDEGFGAGDFMIADTLFSGFYELRAYTRWMLNFNVTKHPYGRKDREQFYNKRMADDFFRKYGATYSRVIPVYEKPQVEGNFAARYFVSRPKTRYDKEEKDRLVVNFFPEGGHLVEGTKCKVAFEAKDEEGRQVDLEGSLDGIKLKTIHEGRGVFEWNVTATSPKAHFEYHGKQYDFDLPKVEKKGCALAVEMDEEKVRADIHIRGMEGANHLAAVILCRGMLQVLQEFTTDQQGKATVTMVKEKLTTGVNDLIIIDEQGTPMADRLFFVNNHDLDNTLIETATDKDEYMPFEPINLTIHAPEGAELVSIAVRDRAGEQITYDTGNILTDLILGSEVRGFVPNPGQYFLPGEEHQRQLDLLLRVQGWRRYDYNEITSGQTLRYTPEKNFSIEGGVYKTVDFEPIRNCEMRYWTTGVFGVCDGDEEFADPNSQDVTGLNKQENDFSLSGVQMETIGQEVVEAEKTSADDPYYGVNHGGLGYEVTVEGELVKGKDIATVEMETDNGGHFKFNLPPFYGDAILFLQAHKSNLSEEKMKKRRVEWAKEDAWPDYYVKRDLFFPIFADKYDFYQCHFPEINANVAKNGEMEIIQQERLSSMDADLDDLEVKGKRKRGKRGIDYTKPVFVGEAGELYNLVTDYGLSFGKLNFRRFPQQLCMLLFGNYNSERPILVDAKMNDYLYFRNYKPDEAEQLLTEQNRSDYAIAKDLVLARQDEIRFFTDFELRNEQKDIGRTMASADVTLDFVTLPNEARRTTYRDRRIILHGIYMPDDFYHPDYSTQRPPEEVKDYRRTLYWNPNAPIAEDGTFTTTFYNNSKETRVTVDAAGLTHRGPIHTK